MKRVLKDTANLVPWSYQRLISSFLLSLALFGCGSYVPPIPGLKPIGEDEEVRISREFRREAKKHFKFVSDPIVERYIDQVGQRLLSVMGPQPFDYRFFVIHDSQLNAFAVPGGSIYVHTGLLERATTTSEVAGVMGHEIIHIKGRHLARLSGPDPIAILSLLGIILGRGGAASQAAGAIGQALSATRQFSYSRQVEMEADTLGARYMAQAGYDPRGSLSFLKMLEQDRVLNPIELPPYMMTHPVTQERVANIELVIRSLGQESSKPEEPDPLKKVQVILRIEKHDTDGLLEDYEKLVQRDSENAEALYLLAFAQHQSGRLPQAKVNYIKARSLNPRMGGIDRELGRLSTQMGEFGEAHEAFNRALAAEPKEPLNYFFLGELYEKQSDLPRAAGAYLGARNLARLWSKPPYRLGVVYGKMNRLGEAYYYLGSSNLLQDEDEKAIADLERAIKIFGANSPRGQIIKEELAVIKARRG